jgi:glycerophosphoryl diester phosphodiesterase
MPAAMRSRHLILVVALLAASVAATAALAAGSGGRDRDHRPSFDLQAHRGGLALRPENTLPAFENAMRLGVSTIELDIQITEDGEAVVTHDRQVTGVKCRDTAPAVPGDPEYPYVGKYVHTLTLAQVRTLDCGTRRPPDPRTDPYLPTLVMKPGERMPTLEQVLELVKRRGDRDLKLNIETKVEAGAPHETAPREQFVQVAARDLRRERMLHRATIQSFDWGALMRMGEVEPRLPLVALVVPNFLQVGQPGASPWLGGIDIDDFGGDPVAAVDSFGADAISPLHGDPQGGAVYWPEYRPFTTRDLVERAHRAGLEVIPWTVNDRPTMEKLIDDGVDGLITDFPDRLRVVLEERGYRLP